MYFEQCAEVYAQKIEQAFETALLASATGHATTGTLLGDLGWALGAVAGSNVGGALVMLVSADIYAEWFTTLAGGGIDVGARQYGDGWWICADASAAVTVEVDQNPTYPPGVTRA
jgi:hypothetical protein